ncbi:MAG: VOC family protein [Actinomycetota bacterium]|nr:VOC family protein [Actinomycetota bacterium]
MVCKLTEVVVDAVDPERLAGFWAQVLGWQMTGSYEGAVEVGDPDDPRPTLVFVPVPEAKAGKNRVHLDLNPTGCDQHEELARLLALGAVEVDVGQGDQTWVVLADPEGNEFCLLRTRIG